MNGIQPGIRWPGTPPQVIPDQPQRKIVLISPLAISVVTVVTCVLLLVAGQLVTSALAARRNTSALPASDNPQGSSKFLQGMYRPEMDDNNRGRKEAGLGSESNNHPYLVLYSQKPTASFSEHVVPVRITPVEVKVGNLKALEAALSQHQQLRQNAHRNRTRLLTVVRYIPPQDASDGSENPLVQTLANSQNNEFLPVQETIMGKRDGVTHNPKDAWQISSEPQALPMKAKNLDEPDELPDVPASQDNAPPSLLEMLPLGIVIFFVTAELEKALLRRLILKQI